MVIVENAIITNVIQKVILHTLILVTCWNLDYELDQKEKLKTYQLPFPAMKNWIQPSLLLWKEVLLVSWNPPHFPLKKFYLTLVIQTFIPVILTFWYHFDTIQTSVRCRKSSSFFLPAIRRLWYISAMKIFSKEGFVWSIYVKGLIRIWKNWNG